MGLKELLQEAIKRLSRTASEIPAEEIIASSIGDDGIPESDEEWDAEEAAELLAESKSDKVFFVAMDTDSLGRPSGITMADGLGNILIDEELNPDDYSDYVLGKAEG